FGWNYFFVFRSIRKSSPHTGGPYELFYRMKIEELRDVLIKVDRRSDSRCCDFETVGNETAARCVQNIVPRIARKRYVEPCRRNLPLEGKSIFWTPIASENPVPLIAVVVREDVFVPKNSLLQQRETRRIRDAVYNRRIPCMENGHICRDIVAEQRRK